MQAKRLVDLSGSTDSFSEQILYRRLLLLWSFRRCLVVFLPKWTCSHPTWVFLCMLLNIQPLKQERGNKWGSEVENASWQEQGELNSPSSWAGMLMDKTNRASSSPVRFSSVDRSHKFADNGHLAVFVPFSTNNYQSNADVSISFLKFHQKNGWVLNYSPYVSHLVIRLALLSPLPLGTRVMEEGCISNLATITFLLCSATLKH